MKVEIEIPKEFEVDFKEDRFKDFFERVLIDVKCGVLCGNYEKETAEMFIKAFYNAKEDNSISKEKIREKIKDLEYNSTLGFEETMEETFKIDILKELLEEEK